MPHRERYLLVCINRRDENNPKGSCAAKGAEGLAAAFKKSLVDHGLHKRLRSCTTSCLDLCEIGAAVLQEPEHVAYGNVTESDVEEIVQAAAKGEVVERLVVHRPAVPA